MIRASSQKTGTCKSMWEGCFIDFCLGKRPCEMQQENILETEREKGSEPRVHSEYVLRV